MCPDWLLSGLWFSLEVPPSTPQHTLPLPLPKLFLLNVCYYFLFQNVMAPAHRPRHRTANAWKMSDADFQNDGRRSSARRASAGPANQFRLCLVCLTCLCGRHHDYWH